MSDLLTQVITGMSQDELQQRKGMVQSRLGEISITEPLKKTKPATNSLAKKDTHWDFLMKEMMWLAADFSSERKRQHGLARKVSNGIKQYYKTKESRYIRELAQAEVKRRRTAAKIGRLAKGWWTKIERVISYKQKLDSDKERRNAMNQQLVDLVKLTERYGETITTTTTTTANQQTEVGGSSDGGGVPTQIVSIEQALSAAARRKMEPSDYSRLELAPEDTELYGESTTEESGSDGSFVVDSGTEDDETTMKQAEEEEILERRGTALSSSHDSTEFAADPQELLKLEQESMMDIEQVLARLQKEAEGRTDLEGGDEEMKEDSPDVLSKRVTFAATVRDKRKRSVTRRSLTAVAAVEDSGHDADDDGDISDVEDFEQDPAGDMSDGSDEFQADNTEVDDETTIEAEERLGRDISADEEINLLQQEGEMPIEELRKMYAAMEEAQSSSAADCEDDVDDPADTKPASQPMGPAATITEMFEEDDAEDEFKVTTDEVDDETTIEAEERLGRDMAPDKEISLLQQESEIPIDQLRAMYATMAAQQDDSGDVDDDEKKSPAEPSSATSDRSDYGILLEESTNDDEEEEFVVEKMEVDDETTMEAEERLGRDMTYESELSLLKKEGEMSVEELRKLYYGATTNDPTDESGDDFPDEYEGDDGEDEFEPDVKAADDETTMEAEEKLGREMSVEDELETLKRESEIDIEELRAKYANHDDIANEGTGLAVRHNSKRRRVKAEEDEEGLDALETLRQSEERAKMTVASRPFLLSSWVKLRKYQQVGLNWLVSIQTRRLNGILADEMGLGKTLQTISLLAYLAAYKGIWGPHLVIVPTSVILNWETELKRFCPGFKVLCYYGSAKRRKELRTGWTKANWYHVVITSYQLAVQDSFAFKRKKWYYLILDEAHHIKNFQSQRWQTLINFNTQRRLLLTGTPLQNSLIELWSLLHFLMPTIFRSRAQFSYWFSNPMNNIIEGNSKRSDDLISRLHGIIRPFVLRRLKKDVETQLPGKFEHLVTCQMSRRQMFLYEEFISRSSTRQALKKGGNFMGMMNVLMQLRKVCNHPDLFEPRAVITPFAMEGIDFIVPPEVIGCLDRDVRSALNDYIISPFWCASSGTPCPTLCLDHDSIIQEEIQRLTVPATSFAGSLKDDDIDEPLPEAGMNANLAKHLKSIWEIERTRKEKVKQSQSMVNAWRCETNSFLYPKRLQRLVSTELLPLERESADFVQQGSVISTPAELLALRKSLKDIADDFEETIKRFVFCIPKAGAPAPRMEAKGGEQLNSSQIYKTVSVPLEEHLKPYSSARARLSSFFPDKRLVQFDAGKLQTLSNLLHDLKRGSHRVLIFTQMSKMLDILEAFLNLNGHAYLRLDGSTGVERRQRLMDKFNNDDKVFCFILSTRSGGLGINLTGADTVIFYDSDWNPSIDAQAQDRAHRIGQTREVHIYRLITEHSIEENIWTKAKQKRQLDLLVMDEGNFNAESDLEKKDDLTDLYSKGGIKEILGYTDDDDDDDDADTVLDVTGKSAGGQAADMTSEQMEKAMASLEDEDDAIAMAAAKKEAAEELKEFDESVEYKKEDDDDDKQINGATKQPAKSETDKTTDEDDDDNNESKQEEKMVKEFNEWQNQVGMDASAIENSLSPTEQYALRFRENVDPFWSVFAIQEYRRRMEAEEDGDDEDVDIEQLEREKEYEEQLAFQEGDLLGTTPRPEELPRQRHVYLREKARIHAAKKRRKLTGENWVEKEDGQTQLMFWYNEDTGEAVWEKPNVIVELEAMQLAEETKWNGMPLNILLLVMSFLSPFPDRTKSALVCRQWKAAATDISFVLHVLPVEQASMISQRQLRNHFATISDALAVALPGDTIELGDGHYWVKEPGLKVNIPVRFIGDEHDPSHVIIELSGTIDWHAPFGFLEGITVRRPKIQSTTNCSSEILSINSGGNVNMVHCILDNNGNDGTVTMIKGGTCRWYDVGIKGSRNGFGMVVSEHAKVILDTCEIIDNKKDGILCKGASEMKLINSHVDESGGYGLLLREQSTCEISRCQFARNKFGILHKEAGSTCAPCSANIAIVAVGGKASCHAGFRLVRDTGHNANASS